MAVSNHVGYFATYVPVKHLLFTRDSFSPLLQRFPGDSFLSLLSQTFYSQFNHVIGL